MSKPFLLDKLTLFEAYTLEVILGYQTNTQHECLLKVKHEGDFCTIQYKHLSHVEFLMIPGAKRSLWTYMGALWSQERTFLPVSNDDALKLVTIQYPPIAGTTDPWIITPNGYPLIDPKRKDTK